MPPPQTDDQFDHRSPTPPHQEEPLEDIPIGPTPCTINNLALGLDSLIDDLKRTAQFIEGLQGATSEGSNMRQEDIDRLHAAEPDLRLDIMDEHFVKALRVFLSTTNASQTTYDSIRSALMECYPEDPFLSFWQVKQRVKQLTGVVPSFYDMCPDTCVGFTGPLVDCDRCPM